MAATTPYPSMPGPLINSAPSTIILLTPSTLPAYPNLPQLARLINVAFASTHTRDNLFPADMKRLSHPGQLVDEIGPLYFTYIITSSTTADSTGAPRIYAAASGRKLLPKGEGVPNEMRQLERMTEGGSDDKRWELKMLVVDPALHAQGLGSLLMGLVEAEVRKRFEERTVAEAVVVGGRRDKEASGKEKVWGVKGKRCLLLLDTLKEVNEAYYLKKGFTATEERSFPVGAFGSSTGFSIIYMEKILAV